MKRQNNWEIIESSPKGGFTLVEMLVSISVLALLVVMVTQLTNAASNTIANSLGHVDADYQARVIFDRMANDFAKMVRRKDVDYLFPCDENGNNGNDAMFFYSAAPAYFDTSLGASSKSTVALVGYRVNSNYQLERLGKGLTWDGASSDSTPGGMVFLAYLGTTPRVESTIAGHWSKTIGEIPYSDSKDSDYHVIGDQVYRMEISYLLKSGILSTKPWDIEKHNAINGFQDVSAIVVTIAMIDSHSQKTITDHIKLEAALPDAENGKSTAQAWLKEVNNTNFAQKSGISRFAAAQVHIYERYFNLANNSNLSNN